jgi:hypothetical protein
MSPTSRAGLQRQRHGVAKNLAEGAGGLIVGAALVLLWRGLSTRRRRVPVAAIPAPASGDPPAGGAVPGAPADPPTDPQSQPGAPT